VLQKVAVRRWSLDAYEGIAPAPILEELREHARALRGARILHVTPPHTAAASQSCCARACRCYATSA
jgi:hypothetical protein